MRRIPGKPYTVCIQDGPVELFVGVFAEAMEQVPKNGVALAQVEVDMVYLRYPELFQTWIDAGSSRYGADNVPSLDVDGDGPRVYAIWVDSPGGDWRLLSRGEKLGT